LSPLLEVAEDEVELVDPEVLAPERDRMANSTRPEVGFRITSLIVPMVDPCELLTVAPMSCVARIFCWLVRPVAPSVLLLDPELEDPKEPELELDPPNEPELEPPEELP
jgi:hypothetical protein